MIYSTSFILVCAITEVVPHLRKQFTHALYGEPDGYRWQFIPEGDVLFERRDGTIDYAEKDVVRIIAYRERSK